jgi:hypothetical protein
MPSNNTSVLLGLGGAAVAVWYLHDRYGLFPTLHLPPFPFLPHPTPTAPSAPSPPAVSHPAPAAVPEAPPAPTLVRTGIEQGKAYLVISWPASRGATSYEIVHLGGHVIATVHQTRATIVGLTPGGTLTVGVRACNSRGCSAVAHYTEFRLASR